jgi:hypothetical protein
MSRAGLIEAVQRLRQLADLGSRDQLAAELFSLVETEKHQQPASAGSPVDSREPQGSAPSPQKMGR